MLITTTKIQDVKLIHLKPHNDSRGFFIERFNKTNFQKFKLSSEFVQDNHSQSSPGVLRGLHFQTKPSQGKLVSCLKGAIWDVVVDLRLTSSTFGQWEAFELSEQNNNLLWVPEGLAHGFCVLGNKPADVLYKVTAPFSPQTDSGILWNDPSLKINWPISNPIVSEKDQNLKSFADFTRNPVLDWSP